jgi:ankyrin repeat protein
MQNVNVPNDPRGTKRRREEESPQAGEPALKRARTHSNEDSQDVSEDVSDDNSEEVSEHDGIPAPLFTKSDELYLAVYEGNTVGVAAYLKQSPQLLDAHLPAEGGLTPLCLAAKLGDLDMVRVLVSAGAAINAPAKNGQTPLMCASMKGGVNMIAALCRLGADPRIIDPVTGSNALTFAISGKHLETCKMLSPHFTDVVEVISFGTDNTKSFERHSPLRYAIFFDFVELIDWWLDRNHLNADIWEPSTPATLLAVAAMYGASSVVASLVERGATLHMPNMYVPEPRLQGVWQIAAHFGRPAVIECLLNQGFRRFGLLDLS